MNAKKFNRLLKDINESHSFAELYRFYYPKIVTHIFNKYRIKDLSEDVAQIFFLDRIKEGYKKYIEKPTTWIYTVCDNIMKDIIASEKKYDLAFKEEESTSADVLFENMLYGEYKKQLDKFDKETQTILIMHYFEGYKLREIANELGINYNTVRQKCSRGTKKIRKI